MTGPRWSWPVTITVIIVYSLIAVALLGRFDGSFWQPPSLRGTHLTQH